MQEVGTVALVHILSQQLSDFLEEKKGRRFELEDEMTELRLWIAMKQAELARDITRLDTEFRPASEYKQMDEQDLTGLFFEKYEEECRRDEKEAAPLSESLLEMVRTRYANEVRESHMYEFCRVDGRKQLLLDYAHQKIAFAVQVGEPRVANSFRRYLAAAGGEMFDEVREEVEIRPPIPRAGRGRGRAGRGPANAPLASLLDTKRVLVKQVVGRKPAQPLRQKVEMMTRNVGLLFGNLMLEF